MAPGMLATLPVPAPSDQEPSPAEGLTEEERHLRSTVEVLRYVVVARDGDAGKVVDFRVEDETWQIHHLVVDTTRWWPGNEVIMAPTWVTKVNWADRTIEVDLTRETIQKSPEFRPGRE